MPALTRRLLLLAALSLPAGAGLAQTPPTPPDEPPPERTITIEQPDRIDADTRGPAEERIESTPNHGSDALVPVRDSFVDRMLESASDI